jgi:hypothetical protein
MTILHMFAGGHSLSPFCRAQTFVLARLISINCGSGDIRGAMVALTLRLLGAGWTFGQRQFDAWARNVLRRAWLGARFAADLTDADSMVAAGGR